MTPYISKHERARGAWTPLSTFEHRGAHYLPDDLDGPRCGYCGGPMVKALGELTHPTCPDPEPPPKRRGNRRTKKK